MAIPIEEQFPNGDIIELESGLEEAASYHLSELIQAAEREGDKDLKNMLLSLWDNEHDWNTLMERVQTEGSAWYVWWMDGVRAFIQREVREIPVNGEEEGLS